MSTGNKYCRYQQNVYSPESKKNKLFECKEAPLKSGFCKLHDENYISGHEAEIEKIIYNKLNNSKKNGTMFNCIGNNLPELNFEDTVFSFYVNFSHAKFYGEVIFDNGSFDQYTDFSHVIFCEDTSFHASKFCDEVNFSYIKSKKNINFSDAKFLQKSDFRYITMEDGTFFSCEFKETDFSESTFNKSISFSSTKFRDTVYYIGCKFKDEVYFTSTRFFNDGIFEDIKFSKKCSFRNVTFMVPKSIIIDTDLSFVSFLNTIITRVRFGNNISWSIQQNSSKFFKKIINDIINTNNKRYKIYDERLLENTIESKVGLESVLDVYRNLRENFDYYLRYDEAGEFFVREMELKRKFKVDLKAIGHKTSEKNRVLRRFSLLGWYDLISQYGQSLFRPVLSAGIILTFFVFAFATNNFSSCNYDDYIPTCDVIKSHEDSIYRGLSSFFPFYSLYEKPLELSDLILRIILLPISGTFFIALKRKLERKFRH